MGALYYIMCMLVGQLCLRGGNHDICMHAYYSSCGNAIEPFRNFKRAQTKITSLKSSANSVA